MENNNQGINTVEGSMPPVATPKTYSEQEVQQMLQSEADRRVNQAREKWEKEASRKISEAEKLAGMSEEQKLKYSLEQKEREFAARERELVMKENKTTASQLLNERGLPLQLLDLVVAEDAETTLKHITALETSFKEAVAAQVKTVIGGNTPKASIATPSGPTKAEFIKMNYTQRMELLKSNPQLYKTLSGL